MKEYDIFVPLHFNDGRRVPARTLEVFKRLLVQQFGGMTNFPQENEGLWKVGGVTFRDRVIVYRVLTSQPRAARRFFAKLKQVMESELQQEEILIVSREVQVV